MKKEQNGYQPLKENADFESLRSLYSGNSIIKRKNVKLGVPKMVQPFDEKPHDKKKVQIQMLKEEDDIVGVLIQCACGEVVKIHFDFED